MPVEIFNFYEYIDKPQWFTLRNTWHALVHVCRRWRYVVFASPRRLNLRLPYRGHRPMSEVLDAWPVLPVSLMSTIDQDQESDQLWNNTVAALESEHYNRICEICVNTTNSRWEKFVAVMQKPFPELTHLRLELWTGDMVPVLPDSFLGGPGPHLRMLYLRRIPFPSMPKLLLSANGLVKLALFDIPDSGYISPDAMATALTAMTRLETLHLGFLSPPPRPDPAIPPPTRFVLPALTQLGFKGVYEYLEDLLARIDAPLLYSLNITFFMVLDLDVPQLHRLIGHAKEFKTFDQAAVSIFDHSIELVICPKTRADDDLWQLHLEIKCRELDRLLSFLAQFCSPSFPLISVLEELDFIEYPQRGFTSLDWKDYIENAQFLELLGPFTGLKSLYLSHEIAQRFCGALQELSGERATEVLPALRNLFVSGFSSLQVVEEAMIPFIAARQLSGHPVVVDHWRN